MDKFIKRSLWQDLIKHLDNKEIGIILGPRQVGKTTLILKLIEYVKEKGISEKYIYYYNLDDIDLRTKIKRDFKFIKKDIELNLGHSLEKERGQVYLFIDEGQKSPAIFDLVKIFYDRGLPVKIFISGSSSINIKDKTAETLSGRVTYFYLSPFTFEETVGKDFGFYQLIEEIKNEDILKRVASKGYRKSEEYRQILDKALFLGSLPKVFLASREEAISYLNNFLSTYLDKDIKDIGSKVNLENFHLSFKYLAEYTADLFNFSKISADLGIKRDSLYRYFELLEKTLVISTLSPFVFPEIKNIFKSRKLFFFDCGVANRLRGFMSLEEIKRAHFLGKVFENFIFQNLSAKASNDLKKPSFFHFRDYQNHEIDFVYHRGSITIPIEATYSQDIPLGKIRNFRKFFSFRPRAKYGIIFYLGEVKTFTVFKKPIFAVPFFLV